MNTKIDTKLAAQIALFAFDGFAVNVQEVADELKSDLKTARKYLDLLTHEGMLIEDIANGKERVWQFQETHDTINRAEAERRTGEWASKVDAIVKTPEVVVPVANSNACKCGCGETVNPSRLYRPGHDARHAGRIGKLLATMTEEELIAETWTTQLPTPALKTKALNIAASQRAKAAKKAASAERKAERAVAKLHRPKNVVAEKLAPVVGPIVEVEFVPVPQRTVEGTVKIGRWTYPASQIWVGDDMISQARATKRNGSGEWVNSTEAFTAN